MKIYISLLRDTGGDLKMLKKFIEWIKSCFSGSVAVSDQSRGKVNVDIAEKKARDRGSRGILNG